MPSNDEPRQKEPNATCKRTSQNAAKYALQKVLPDISVNTTKTQILGTILQSADTKQNYKESPKSQGARAPYRIEHHIHNQEKRPIPMHQNGVYQQKFHQIH
jgi:hypothetical protein